MVVIYKKIIDREDEYISEAAYRLGLYYYKENIRKEEFDIWDRINLISYFSIAVKNNHIRAICKLAKFYKTEDEDEMKRFLKKAIKLDSVKAMYKLAKLYIHKTHSHAHED